MRYKLKCSIFGGWNFGRLPHTILLASLPDGPSGFHMPFYSWNIFGQCMTSCINQRRYEKKQAGGGGGVQKARKAWLQICRMVVIWQMFSPSLTINLIFCKMGVFLNVPHVHFELSGNRKKQNKTGISQLSYDNPHQWRFYYSLIWLASKGIQ